MLLLIPARGFITWFEMMSPNCCSSGPVSRKSLRWPFCRHLQFQPLVTVPEGEPLGQEILY
jgi:hypothetical protein